MGVGADSLPWDGVTGPQEIPGENGVEYAAFDYIDYVRNALENRFSLKLTQTVDVREYKARVLAMYSVYQVLAQQTNTNLQTIRRNWTLLSFRKINSVDGELREAQADTGTSLATPLYRFEMYRYGNRQLIPPRNKDERPKYKVDIEERGIFFVKGNRILFKLGSENWQVVDLDV